MFDIYSKREIIGYYKRKSLTINKLLGQNFLVNQSVCQAIIDTACINNSSENFLEIGPGLGNLTRILCSKDNIKTIVCVEKDINFFEVLSCLEKQFTDKISLHFMDFIDFNLDTLHNQATVIGNLPYNLSTHFIRKFIHSRKFYKMYFTLQHEVANRICAKHSTSDYGYLSVLCQVFFNCNKIFDIDSASFFPVPKVNSSVLSMVPKVGEVSDITLTNLSKLLHCVFSKRRKMVGKSLRALLPHPVVFLNKMCIEPTRRPQDISVSEYLHIANNLFLT